MFALYTGIDGKQRQYAGMVIFADSKSKIFLDCAFRREAIIARE
jgi:hypothetical protein